jgi:hypothetical protein
MQITIDLENPDNDVIVVGLGDGESIETRLGPRGYAAYRIFGSAARLLFLATQNMSKPDIAAATEMMIDKESTFIRQRLNDLRPGGMTHGATQGSQRSGQRPPDRRNPRDRGRR